MKRAMIVTILAAVACGFLTSRAGLAEKSAQADRSELMQRKLADSQELLRGLALEDFDLIAANAKELNQISLEAEWTEALSPLYGKYGMEFRTAADRIAQSANEKNLDGAALNYFQLVTACVHCHKAVRGSEDIAFSPGAVQPPVGD